MDVVELVEVANEGLDRIGVVLKLLVGVLYV